MWKDDTQTDPHLWAEMGDQYGALGSIRDTNLCDTRESSIRNLCQSFPGNFGARLPPNLGPRVGGAYQITTKSGGAGRIWPIL